MFIATHPAPTTTGTPDSDTLAGKSTWTRA